MAGRTVTSCPVAAELASLKQSSPRGQLVTIHPISFSKACPTAEPALGRDFLMQSEGLLLGAGVLGKTEGNLENSVWFCPIRTKLRGLFEPITFLEKTK